ncbi:MAG: hypothetical protein MZV63_22175 [Marinilabiliales bacterium]|nr:hypothetical protein [Marinilabiliales bacterium]
MRRVCLCASGSETTRRASWECRRTDGYRAGERRHGRPGGPIHGRDPRGAAARNTPLSSGRLSTGRGGRLCGGGHTPRCGASFRRRPRK